ncbi:MAG: hypothetical protein JWM50_1444 [Microbacteriaceae bacterium]|jgi:hypothetical protein|nr:hypothetical protein [Microbacteriaceae bacterium]
MAIQISSSHIDTAGFETEPGSAECEPQPFLLTPHFTTMAHPFSEDDLRAFIAAGEHAGLE